MANMKKIIRLITRFMFIGLGNFLVLTIREERILQCLFFIVCLRFSKNQGLLAIPT